MGFMVNQPNDQQRIDAMGADNPITELTPDGAFSGSGGAIVGGIVGGAAAVGRTAYDFLTQANKGTELTYDPQADVHQTLADQTEMSPAINDALKRTEAWARIDPRVEGTAAQTLGTAAHGITVGGLGALAGGPAGAAVTLAGTEGYSDYRENVAAGMDPTTALEKAGLTGTLAGASVFLPMSFGAAAGVKGLASALAGGVAINTGVGVAQRFLTSELLSANGYKDMAQQYRPVDANAMAADAILGLAFGGFGHLMHGADVPAAERPTADLVEQAMDARRIEANSRGGAGIPTDPAHATMDGDLQDRALGNMLRGKPADITPEEATAMVDHSIVDPERREMNEAHAEAGKTLYGDIGDMTEPPRAAVADQPYVAPEAIEAPSGPAQPGDATTAPQISPVASSMLDQLAARHPDLEIDMPDGSTVNPSQFRDAMSQNASAVAEHSKLIDAAVSCFLRVGA
jgi:hypothetical protein